LQLFFGVADGGVWEGNPPTPKKQEIF